MKWDAYVKSLSSKLSKFSYIIKSLTGVKSPRVLRNICFLYFCARLKYGLIFWGVDSKLKLFLNYKNDYTNNMIVQISRQLNNVLSTFPVPGMYTRISEIICYIKLHKPIEKMYNIYINNIVIVVSINVDDVLLMTADLTETCQGWKIKNNNFYHHTGRR
jgi:hypothetical protein